MVTIDYIYKTKYTISELLLNNPILASDLIDQLYIIASKEPGLSLWKYDANDRITGIQIQIGYNNLINKKTNESLFYTMCTYVEGLLRDPKNYPLLTQLGMAGFIDMMDQNVLRECITHSFTVLDLSNGERSTLIYKIA